MKNSKKIIIVFLLVAIFIPSIWIETTRAEEIPTYTTVTITAEVPDGFDGEIAIAFTDERTLVPIKTALVAENGYSSKVMLLSDSTYLSTVVIRGGEYRHNLEKKYQFSGDQATLIFQVVDAFQPLPDDSDTETNSKETLSDRGKDIDELTGIETAESVFRHFIEVCSVMEDNPAYTDYLTFYSGNVFKQIFLEDKSNTEEMWNSMTLVQRYERYISSTLPKISYMSGNSIEDEKTYLDEVQTNLIKLNNIEGGAVIRDEVLAVWSWLHRYYLHTGTFYDFYDDQNLLPTPPQGGAPLETPTGTQQEIQEENGIVAWIQNNVLMLIIIVGAGVTFITILALSKRKLQGKE